MRLGIAEIASVAAMLLCGISTIDSVLGALYEAHKVEHELCRFTTRPATAKCRSVHRPIAMAAKHVKDGDLVDCRWEIRTSLFLGIGMKRVRGSEMCRTARVREAHAE